MHTEVQIEVPVLNKCCCCLPLRNGLLGWGYVKLILSSILLLNCLWGLSIMMSSFMSYYYEDIILSAIFLFMLFADIVLHVIFVLGAHKKDVKYLTVYYYYSISIMALTGLLSFVYIFMMLNSYRWFEIHGLDILDRASLFTVGLLIQAYILLLVRSEIIAIKNSVSCKFDDKIAETKSKKLGCEWL